MNAVGQAEMHACRSVRRWLSLFVLLNLVLESNSTTGFLGRVHAIAKRIDDAMQSRADESDESDESDGSRMHKEPNESDGRKRTRCDLEIMGLCKEEHKRSTTEQGDFRHNEDCCCAGCPAGGDPLCGWVPHGGRQRSLQEC